MVSTRQVVFINDYFYHIYNRGVEKRTIYETSRDYTRFLLALKYYRPSSIPLGLSKFLNLSIDRRLKLLQTDRKPRVEILSYCLMPNHFHLLLRQKVDKGISHFLNDISNSYTRYFNTKHERVGPLYQGPFKAVHIETDDQLLHVSRYIHLNPYVASLCHFDKIEKYPWSSIVGFLSNKKTFINPKPILKFFSDKKEYISFLKDQADYAKELKRIQHLSLEE